MVCGILLACDPPLRETAAVLDLSAREVRGQCEQGPVEWQKVDVGPEQRRGFRQAQGDHCTFELDVPPASQLDLRVARSARRGRSPEPMQVRVLAVVAGDQRLVFESGLAPGDDVAADALPLPIGATRIVFEVEAAAQDSGPTAFAIWSDIAIRSRHVGALDPALFSTPIQEAVRDYLDAASGPGTDGLETRRGHRLLVVGIDGASWPLLDGLIAEGLMPNVAALRRRAITGNLESTIIPESAMAWTTIRTGVYPGKHGVFHFLSSDRVRSSYWTWLSDAGLRSVIAGVPKSRIDEQFDGVLVGGWNYTREEPYAQPAALKTALDRAHYDPLIAYMRNSDYFMERMSARTDIFLTLLDGMAWDQAFIVYEYSDTAGHVFGLQTDAWKQVYAAVDREVGRLLDAVGPETTLLLISDHGWERYAGSVAPEAWLAAHDFRGWSPNIFSGNRVALSSTPRLSPEMEAEQLAKIENALSTINEPSTGRPLVRRLVRAAEAFAGPFAARVDARAIIELEPDYHAAAKVKRKKIVIEEPIEHHALQGFYLVAGPGIKPGPGRAGSVVDVAPTVARFFDVSPPPDTDGASLIDFSSGTAAAKAQPPATPSANVRTPLPEAIPQTEKVSEALRERLRALGYVDE